MATDLGINFVPQAGVAPAQVWADAGETLGNPTTRGGAHSGYTLWMYDGSEWSMTKDRSAEGYVPSAAPTVPGRFRGQVRAILSVLPRTESST
jgi:hypothetical protein